MDEQNQSTQSESATPWVKSMSKTEQDIAQLRQMLTVVQIAHILNKHPVTIRKWLNKPDCPLNPKKMYGQWRVSRLDLARYIDDSGVCLLYTSPSPRDRQK